MSEITNQLIKPTDEQRFELAQREAKALTASTLVPKDYQNNPANCMIAIDISKRMGLSPIMVMQNLDIIHGRPSWRSQFIIGAINSCGRFGALKFRMSPENGGTCTAYATELATGEIIEGVPVSMEMAKAEGWAGKAGSKWKTMPDLMLRYRAAAFFGRLNCPEILNGLPSADEIDDIAPPPSYTAAAAEVQEINDRMSFTLQDDEVVDEVEADDVVEDENETENEEGVI
jgi:hypothetical protein